MEGDGRRRVKSAKELLERYAKGERDFALANLGIANLRGADLSGADLRYGDLHGANLSGAELHHADLRGADLGGADLGGANLISVNVRGADLRHANLRGTQLSSADLRDTNLSGADLRRANLRDAILSGAKIYGADLKDAIVDRAVLQDTVLANIDLGPFANAMTPPHHGGRSVVDDRSIALSIRSPGLRQFLVDAGMPGAYADYAIDTIKSLDPNELFSLMHSVFISYGGPDEAFAVYLRDALKREGVTTYFARDDAQLGAGIRDQIGRHINAHDRTVAVLSQRSLDPKRTYFHYELERILDREAALGGHRLLIPISLDAFVLKGWEPKREDVGIAIRQRVIGDFRKAVTRRGNVKNEPEFDAAVGRLLRALRKEDVG